MSKITVIVPVYRAEQYICRCIDSILNQSFSELDLVLVDDGSPDRCPDICDRYARQDSRVHVIHQKNSGPSRARNTGLDWAFTHSDSRYLMFVDSDDCIHPMCAELLYRAVQTHNTRVGMCRHQYIMFGQEPKEIQLPPCIGSETVSAEDLMITQSSSFNYAWGKLYEKDLFAQLRYPEDVSFGEDNLIIYRAMFAAETAAFVDQPLYCYFYNAEGITKSPWSSKSLDVFRGIREQLEFYRANGFERAYRKEVELLIQQCAYQIHRIRENPEALDRNRAHLKELTVQMKRTLGSNRQFRLRDNPYWFEALHPHAARVLDILGRMKRTIREKGLAQTWAKILRKILPGNK